MIDVFGVENNDAVLVAVHCPKRGIIYLVESDTWIDMERRCAMPKRTESAFHEVEGYKITITYDESDPERPAEIKKEDMDPADRKCQLEKREREKQQRKP